MKRKLLSLALAISLSSMPCISCICANAADVSTELTTITTTAASNKMHFSVQEGDHINVLVGEGNGLYIAGYNDGIEYDDGETPFVFEIEDESVAEIIGVQGNLVNVKGLRLGETVLTATAPDGQTDTLKIIVSGDPSTTTTTAVWTTAPATTTTTTAVSNNISFHVPHGDYIDAEVGVGNGLTVYGYDDGIEYNIGETPFVFEIEDESVAEIIGVQGNLVNVKGLRLGETVLTATAPNGQTATLKIIVSGDPSATTTTAVWTTEPTTTTTTTAVSNNISFNVPNGDYIKAVVGEGNGLIINGYDDGIEYNAGETPFAFEIEDESVAEIIGVQGNIVNVKGLRLGETVLTATAPNGQVAVLKLIFSIDPSLTTTTAVWTTEPTTTTTTTTTAVSSDNTSELPQTGYSNLYKVLVGIASAMTVTGTAMIARSKKKDEE